MIPFRTFLTAAAAAAMLAVAAPASADSEADGPRYREDVALGDSWSADVLTTFPRPRS